MRKYWIRLGHKEGEISALIVYDRKTGLAHWTDVTPEESILVPIDRPHGFAKRVKKYGSLYIPVTKAEFIRAKITSKFEFPTEVYL